MDKKLLKSLRPVGEGVISGRKVVIISKSIWDKFLKALKDEKPAAKAKPAAKKKVKAAPEKKAKPVSAKSKKKAPPKKSKPGNNLQVKRMAAKLTQAQLGKKVGVSPRTIGRWEAEIHAPSAPEVKKLAKILKCTQATLFPSMK
ncbi:helix-turn-helix transcriptional regulator [Candidatus Riflebacteria bacterium]